MLYYNYTDLHHEQELKCLEEKFEEKEQYFEKKLQLSEENVEKLLGKDMTIRNQ